jgi:hypothetical protein
MLILRRLGATDHATAFGNRSAPDRGTSAADRRKQSHASGLGVDGCPCAWSIVGPGCGHQCT